MGTMRAELEGIYSFKKGATGQYGIEIETEVDDLDDYKNKIKYDPNIDFYRPSEELPGWKLVRDGSLRGFGVEYVFDGPKNFDKALRALDDFGKWSEGIPFHKDAPGTSVHVHINMLDKTFIQMGNFLTIYSLVENLLVEMSGETRRSNLFALPMRCSETTYQNIVKMFVGMSQAKWQSLSHHEGSVKYAALNLCRLTKFGSVEIRTYRGTTDVSDIKRWLELIDKIVTFSDNEDLDPRMIMEIYKTDPVIFFHEVFGGMANDLVGKYSYTNILGMMDRNLWYAASIAYCLKDWSVVLEPFSILRSPKQPKPSSYTEAMNALAGALATTQPSPWLSQNAEGVVMMDELESDF